MKNNIGIIIASFGLLLTMSVTALFQDSQILRYGISGIGVLLTIIGTYKVDRERKLSRH